MGRITFRGMTLGFLVFFSTSAFAGEWITKNPQGAGPKFGDYLKQNNKAVKPLSRDKKTKHKNGNDARKKDACAPFCKMSPEKIGPFSDLGTDGPPCKI